jgi:DNA topoisomerase IB
MVRFARALPAMRERVDADLQAGGERLTRDGVLACAVRLLDKGFFRIGSEDYAVHNDSYGLATMHKAHVTLGEDGVLLFDYPAKHGKQRVQSVVDEEVYAVVKKLKARRGGLPELLAYKKGRTWVDVRSPDINHYLKDRTGLEVSAKDFRTWNATVIAAKALAVSGLKHGTPTGASARSSTRSRRSPTTWATRPPWRARATSIRASSIASTTGSRSTSRR